MEQNTTKYTESWESLAQLFKAMNESLEYCVLRNTEDITSEFSPKIHGDIDILVSDQKAAVELMHAAKVHQKSYRVYYEVPVAGDVVPFDIRYVGDNYYCKLWEQDILASKVLTENGGVQFYIMSPEQQYYTLLYHVYLQKQSISADYPDKLSVYATYVDLKYQNDVEYVVAQLEVYMKENQYIYEFPHDLAVGINWENVKALCECWGGAVYVSSREIRMAGIE